MRKAIEGHKVRGRRKTLELTPSPDQTLSGVKCLTIQSKSRNEKLGIKPSITKMDRCDALNLKLLPQGMVRTVRPGWTGGELGLGAEAPPGWLTSSGGFFTFCMYLRTTSSGFLPAEIMGQRVSGGVGAGLWGAAGRRARRVSRGQAESGACWILRALRLRLGVGGVTRNLLFLRCFFLVLRHTPGTPGTGFTSLLLTGGGCRMGLGARVRHTGSPAAHSRIPVIPRGWRGRV